MNYKTSDGKLLLEQIKSGAVEAFMDAAGRQSRWIYVHDLSVHINGERLDEINNYLDRDGKTAIIFNNIRGTSCFPIEVDEDTASLILSDILKRGDMHVLDQYRDDERSIIIIPKGRTLEDSAYLRYERLLQQDMQRHYSRSSYAGD